MKSVCVVTGTRAEYHLLCPIMKAIEADDGLKLILAVTGAHLSREHGETYRDIEKDGFLINMKIPILQNDDSPNGVNLTMSRALAGFSEFFSDVRPDMLVLLGDRYEMLAVAIAAMNLQIPIAHLYGGETTEGAVDECIRHAITKMSYLHFTACEAYRQRVIQLGEAPDRVFNVGAIGLENIKNQPLMTLKELEHTLSFDLGKRYAVVTFHPVTLEKDTAGAEFAQLLGALNAYPQLHIIFTKSNADAGGLLINHMIDEYVRQHTDRCTAVFSLGVVRYLSALKYAAVVIGNSSSGITETPSFGVPTVNVGDRQRGRIQAKNIISCVPSENAIKEAIALALSEDFRNEVKNTVNPYGDGIVTPKIMQQLKYFLKSEKINLKKKFYNIKFDLDKEGAADV